MLYEINLVKYRVFDFFMLKILKNTEGGLPTIIFLNIKEINWLKFYSLLRFNTLHHQNGCWV
jgi:hypothetical protein